MRFPLNSWLLCDMRGGVEINNLILKFIRWYISTAIFRIFLVFKPASFRQSPDSVARY